MLEIDLEQEQYFVYAPVKIMKTSDQVTGLWSDAPDSGRSRTFQIGKVAAESL
jgi:hypothetical protein